ncbi:MAG TPA: prolyl oligopeptidase family serine peptidase [Vicinamibacterales bacterium]|jgi:prolyl oligopeptidase|nr:prolyl oligopeptidase family serine peptidase [Vicinamibacterales bacterium]
MRPCRSSAAIALGSILAVCMSLNQSQMQTRQTKYPPAPLGDVVDTYHGTKVPDPYRWLEDADAPETVKWVDAQNALTRSFVDGPDREALETRLTDLYNYPRTGIPTKRGSQYFFTHNTGLQNQSVLYVQEGLKGERRALLDPNALAPDGTVALTALAITDDGTRIAYGLSKSGSDRQELFVRDVATAKDHPDHLKWAKFTTISWLKDGAGFYYTRFPEPGTVPTGEENYFGKLYFHRLGDDQAKDRLVYERPDDGEIVLVSSITDDGQTLVITAFQGSSDKSEVYWMDATQPGSTPSPIFTGFGASYQFADAVGSRLFFQTDQGAPLGRVVAVDLPATTPTPIPVIPESRNKLNATGVIHKTLVLSYLENASSTLKLFDLAGKPAGDIALPAIGSVTGISGRTEDDELFFGFTSFTYPPASYRYDFKARQVTDFAKGASRIDPAAYETKQVWYPSKDGTRVSMFLVHRKGLTLDGSRPVFLSGYGGFNVSVTPAFDPANFVWLDRDGVYARVNLRGGGEYGEAWHEAGMFEKKQNVFDDFIAAAEWLIANKYTTAKRLAIEGGSNGGLLVGAALVQRPDLFGAVICRVPVVDMLRYHKFTVGRFWISEYGSADDPKQFPYLIKYSPLHNVKEGVRYPATLITTADTDDRVAPGMAKKFAARLQAAAAGPEPILIRVETKAGHGAGKPITKVIEEEADIYSFLFTVLRS